MWYSKAENKCYKMPKNNIYGQIAKEEAKRGKNIDL